MLEIVAAAEFLYENRDLIGAIARAVKNGVQKKDIQTAIEALEVQFSDEAMREELGTKSGAI